MKFSKALTDRGLCQGFIKNVSTPYEHWWQYLVSSFLGEGSFCLVAVVVAVVVVVVEG